MGTIFKIKTAIAKMVARSCPIRIVSFLLVVFIGLQQCSANFTKNALPSAAPIVAYISNAARDGLSDSNLVDYIPSQMKESIANCRVSHADSCFSVNHNDRSLILTFI